MMKTNLYSVMAGFVLLIAASLGVVAQWGGHVGQKPQSQNEYRLEGPFTQDNLTVFLIQGKDWRQVAVAQDKLSANTGTRVNGASSPTSFQLALENKEVQKTSDSYFKALAGIINGKPDVIGYVFAINGKINSADIYASNALFKKLWPKLLTSSAIEAIAELRRGEKFDAPRPAEVQGFLDDSSKGTEKQKDVSPRVQMVTRDSDGSVFFETRDRAKSDVWVHRNVIKKN